MDTNKKIRPSLALNGGYLGTFANAGVRGSAWDGNVEQGTLRWNCFL